MRLMPIQPGTFMMGQDGPALDDSMGQHRLKEMYKDVDWIDFDEKPAHRVLITRPFLIGVTDVTVAEDSRFDQVFKADVPSYKPADDVAASGISWDQAVAFCAWLSEKEGKMHPLRTEAEWEYARRAGTKRLFQHGDTFPGTHRKCLFTSRKPYVFNLAWIKDAAPAPTK